MHFFDWLIACRDKNAFGQSIVVLRTGYHTKKQGYNRLMRKIQLKKHQPSFRRLAHSHSFYIYEPIDVILRGWSGWVPSSSLHIWTVWYYYDSPNVFFIPVLQRIVKIPCFIVTYSFMQNIWKCWNFNCRLHAIPYMSWEPQKEFHPTVNCT